MEDKFYFAADGRVIRVSWPECLDAFWLNPFDEDGWFHTMDEHNGVVRLGDKGFYRGARWLTDHLFDDWEGRWMESVEEYLEDSGNGDVVDDRVIKEAFEDAYGKGVFVEVWSGTYPGYRILKDYFEKDATHYLILGEDETEETVETAMKEWLDYVNGWYFFIEDDDTGEGELHLGLGTEQDIEAAYGHAVTELKEK